MDAWHTTMIVRTYPSSVALTATECDLECSKECSCNLNDG